MVEADLPEDKLVDDLREEIEGEEMAPESSVILVEIMKFWSISKTISSTL